MADEDTSSASRRAGSDLAVPDRTFMVDTYTAAVTLIDADTGRLASLDQAELNRTAAIGIDTATAHVCRATLYDTVPNRSIAYHIDSAAVARMLAEIDIAAGGITGRDDASVY